MPASKAKTIAVAGKGGVGKTTVSAVLIDVLSRQGTVLAIDADPSANLHLCLGLPLETTVGDVREEAAKTVRSASFQAGMSRSNYLELGVRQSLVESQRVDLLAMGRPEGAGCYCAANNVLRGVIDQMSGNYDYVVIDNEAGLEHLSRQTTRDVDVLLAVSDASPRGLLTAARIKDLVKELGSRVERIGLVLNRVTLPLSEELESAAKQTGLELLGALPADAAVAELDARGEPLGKLPEDSSLRQAVIALACRIGFGTNMQQREGGNE